MEPTAPPRGDQPLPPAGDPGPQRTGGDGFFDSLRRVGVVRTQDRWIGGVSGGVALRFGVDPLLVRGLLGVTVLLGGAGLVLYGLAWALLPEEVDGRIHLEETVRGRFDAAILGALAFVIVGANRGSGWLVGWDDRGSGWGDGLLWVAAVVAVVAVLVAAGRRQGPARAVPHPGYGSVPATTAAAPPPPATGTTTGAASGSAGLSGGTDAASGVTGATAPTGAAAYRAAPPAAAPWPPAPPRPPKPRVLGPGVGMVGTVVGLTLIALATLLVLGREGVLHQPVALTALGVGIVLAGLGIIASGLRGRRSGVLGFLAIVGLLLAGPVAVAAHAGDQVGPFAANGRWDVSTGEVWRPDTVAEARRGLSVGVGDVPVDLTAVPLGDGPVEVPISMTAGELLVIVPADAAVTADVSMTVGEFRWDVDRGTATGGSSGFSGISGRTQTYRSAEAADGDVDLAIHITAGAGDVRVVEEDR